MTYSSPHQEPDYTDDAFDLQLSDDLSFERYFTLDEAATLIPSVRAALEQAHRELETAKDTVVLFKRILLASKENGKEPSDEQLAHLKELYGNIEEIYAKWIQHFGEQGIILRDLAKGLIDFPYRSSSLHEDFLLCWQLGEDGLFYFHPADAGFSGRQPISLLPE